MSVFMALTYQYDFPTFQPFFHLNYDKIIFSGLAEQYPTQPIPKQVFCEGTTSL